MSAEHNNPTNPEENKFADLGNKLINLIEQAKANTNQRVRFQERKPSDDCDEDECESSQDESEDQGGEEEEEWESLGNLLDSHQRLCQAFLLLLKERHE
jgi:hypothetical protein